MIATTSVSARPATDCGGTIGVNDRNFGALLLSPAGFFCVFWRGSFGRFGLRAAFT
ncbi:hypothetical protein [Roseibium polysiphoniae]|uniref:hypothetical protein n=1 Tax=Roseibium polysiphoniae TaxID=2571221 RepID=UPI001AD903D9|nr:hypothetical protein [Roseibium polysiphoniae]